MALVTHVVKTILLEIPSIGGQTATSPGYTKFVGHEMGKVEALLMVILSRMESVVETSVQLRWCQWPTNQSGASPKWFATNKGFLGVGPSGIMIADAIITEAGTMLVAGVPIVNPSTVVVWEVTLGIGSNP